MISAAQRPLFPRKGFGKENQLFPREHQKNPKTHLLGDYAAKVQMMVFLVSPRIKSI